MTSGEGWLDLYWATSYGTETERFRLSDARGPAPSWVRTGARWALITAHNPGGARATEADNRRADRALHLVLLQTGLPLQRAVNGEDDWREPAWLVRGLGLRAACRLGARFGQLAIIAGVGARAALVPAQPGPERRLAGLQRGWATRLG